VIELFVEWMRAVGAYVGVTLEAALPSIGAIVLVTMLAAVLVLVARSAAVLGDRMIAVGARARRHAILLALLPDASHPDARGHVRSRAPGSLLPIA
jgi:Family of unknown function (DUF6412)